LTSNRDRILHLAVIDEADATQRAFKKRPEFLRAAAATDLQVEQLGLQKRVAHFTAP
jgi:hypothetical protein